MDMNRPSVCLIDVNGVLMLYKGQPIVPSIVER